MPDGFESALRLLPEALRDAARKQYSAAPRRERVEEFRLRSGRAPTVLLGEMEKPLADAAVTESDLRAVLDAATRSSFHAVEDELCRGFIAAEGGVRVGVCGTAATGGGGVKTLREISSLAIRVPRQVVGAGREAMAALSNVSVLILSPPGGGKTTFLRELVRTVSDSGTRVCLADERGEIAAVSQGGAPRFDVGRCTDVLTGAPKAEAAMMLLRAMNPQVVALDEISDPADAAAVTRIAGCGVRIFATAHAADAEQPRQRPLYRNLLDEHIFQKAVVIRAADGRRSYEVRAL